MSDIRDLLEKNLSITEGQLDVRYPYKCCYCNSNTNDQFVHFKYLSQNSDRLVFIAETESQETIIVKFTYSKETREFWALHLYYRLMRMFMASVAVRN